MYNIKYNVYDEKGVPIEKIIITSKERSENKRISTFNKLSVLPEISE